MNFTRVGWNRRSDQFLLYKSNLSAKNANERKEELIEFLFACLASFADESFCRLG